MTTEPTVYAYIGTRHCGHVCFAVIDSKDQKKATARELANAVRNGLQIDRVPVEEARRKLEYCNCP